MFSESIIKQHRVDVRGEHFLNKSKQFENVYNEGKTWTVKEIVLKALPNELDVSRFGLVVSGRLGKAVVRNRVKRRLREITRKMPVQAGWDIVFIARVPAAKVGYKVLEKSAMRLLVRAGIIVGENEGSSLIIN